MSLFAISMPGPMELVLILAIVLILFGVGRLPQVFASFGQGIKAFRDAQKDDPVDVTPKQKALTEDQLAEAEEVERKKAKAEHHR